MILFSKCVQQVCMVAISTILLLQTGVPMVRSQVSQPTAQPIIVVIRTDHERYSPADTVKLNVSLQNTSDTTFYVDRRLFCCGIGSGLELQIRDERGKPVPLHVPSEEIMPPPKDGDLSILIRLDQGFYYGKRLDLPVKDYFPGGGKNLTLKDD